MKSSCYLWIFKWEHKEHLRASDSQTQIQIVKLFFPIKYTLSKEQDGIHSGRSTAPSLTKAL